MPGAWNVTSPESSAPARSKGAANHTETLASMGLPDASFAAALNFTFSPTCASSLLGVISTTAGATDVLGVSCLAGASCDHTPGTAKVDTATATRNALLLNMDPPDKVLCVPCALCGEALLLSTTCYALSSRNQVLLPAAPHRWSRPFS